MLEIIVIDIIQKKKEKKNTHKLRSRYRYY